MRFLSKYAGHTVPAIPPVEMPMPNGKLAVTDKGVTCEFKTLHITEYEFELALREFRFNGQPMEMDNKTDVSPRHRIGVYDTEKEARDQHWNAETRAIVERALLELSQNDNVQAVQSAIVKRNEFASVGNPLDLDEYAAALEPGFEKVMIYVEPQVIPRPWNTYDELVTAPGRSKADVAERIARLAVDIGADIESVLAYERENANRPEVVAKLEAIVPADPEPDPDEIVVQTI